MQITTRTPSNFLIVGLIGNAYSAGKRYLGKLSVSYCRAFGMSLVLAISTIGFASVHADEGIAESIGGENVSIPGKEKGVSVVTVGSDGRETVLPRRRSDTDWTTYNKDLVAQRFSPLTQINTKNVTSLKEVCRIQVSDAGSFHTGPILIDGVMYVTTARDTVAINPTNCGMLWKSTWEPEQDEIWAVNRGVAYSDGRLFRGTADGRLLALDAKTGKQLWKIIVREGKGDFLTAAPIVSSGLVFIGTSGSDWGIRGRMMAFDAVTGKEVWRFNTIPLPNEPGAETWKSDKSSETGGGGMWSSFTLDEKANEIFVSVGNPAPDFGPSYRLGSNLYTDSLVVLDAKIGKLKWWYQLIENDALDHDLGAAPVLYKDSTGRDLVALGGKDGYVYAIDRQTHKLRFKTAVTTIKSRHTPTPEGVVSCPGILGGVEWNGPAFDPRRKALYVGAVDWCSIVKSAEVGVHKPGDLFLAGSFEMVKTPPNGWVTALDSNTGKIKWKYEVGAAMVAGITPTAGGLIFTGDLGGNFLALDSKTGKVLYKTNTNGAIAGGVLTYLLSGKQYVATTSGNVSRLTFGVLGKPSIVIMALDPVHKEQTRSESSVLPTAEPLKLMNRSSDKADKSHGKSLYSKVCAACHGAQGEGGVGLKLQNLSARLTWEQIVDKIVNPTLPMPKLYPSMLSEQDLIDVAAYIRTF